MKHLFKQDVYFGGDVELSFTPNTMPGNDTVTYNGAKLSFLNKGTTDCEVRILNRNESSGVVR